MKYRLDAHQCADQQYILLEGNKQEPWATELDHNLYIHIRRQNFNLCNIPRYYFIRRLTYNNMWMVRCGLMRCDAVCVCMMCCTSIVITHRLSTEHPKDFIVAFALSHNSYIIMYSQLCDLMASDHIIDDSKNWKRVKVNADCLNNYWFLENFVRICLHGECVWAFAIIYQGIREA